MKEKKSRDEFSKTIKEVLIPMFYKESQIGRSVGKNNIKFKRKLFDTIIKLIVKADNLKLENKHIRNAIKNLSEETDVSIGQAQKVINVYLKYYCILTDKPSYIIKELDCPLDSKIMSGFDKNKPKNYRLKNFKNFNDYVSWQNYLEFKGNGIRLKADIIAYDKERINSFFIV